MGRAARTEEDVEFLVPDRNAFANASADGFVDVGGDDPDPAFDDDERPRSPWVTLGAAAGVLALAVGAVVVSAPWEPEGTAAPITVPSTAPATAPATTTPPSTRLDPFSADRFRVELPPDFRVQQVETTTSAGSAWLEVWAAPGADRRSGAWIAVHSTRYRPAVAVNEGRRVLLGRNGIGLLRRTDDGVAVVTFTADDGATVTITGGGEPGERILEIAESLDLAGDGPVFASPPAPLMEPVYAGVARGASFEAAYAFGTIPESRVRYVRANGDHVDLVSGPTVRQLNALARFAIRGVADVGPTAFGGEIPALGVSTVRWETGGTTVALVGSVSFETLRDYASGVTSATPEEWAALEAQAAGIEPSLASTLPGNSVDAGYLIDGRPWRVDLDASGEIASIVIAGAVFEHPLEHGRLLHVIATEQATIVLARVSQTVAAARHTLVIDGPDFGIEIPLTPAGAIGTPWVAAHAFAQIGAFSATLVEPGVGALEEVSLAG